MSQPDKPTILNFTPTARHDTYAFIDPKQYNLSDRSVLITGASKGIGRATAVSFAKAGASRIALAARSSLASVETEILAAAHAANHPAPKVLSLTVDTTDLSSVTAAAERVTTEFGTLDILINNAGFGGNWIPVVESDPEDWWKSWEVNVKGVYYTTRAFLPLLLSTPAGLKTILNVSSIGAHPPHIPGGSAYQTAKLAVLRFGEFVMTEYGDQGVVCFGIHPGGVNTEVAQSLPKDMHELLKDTPQLAGDSMVWLTAEKRDWLGGRYIDVTWDMEEFEGKRDAIEKGDLLKIKVDVGF